MATSEIYKFEKDGKVTEFKFKELTSLDNQYVRSAYAKAFKEALDGGAKLRVAVDKMLEDQGVLDRAADQEKIEEIRKELIAMEIQLRSGKKPDGSKMTKKEGRELAIAMKRKRGEEDQIVEKLTGYYSNTAENVAFAAQIIASLYCATQKADGTPMWESEQEMETSAGLIDYVSTCYYKYQYKINLENADSKDFEVIWLKKHKFVDDKGRFIDEKGRFINAEGRLIDENGRYLNEEGKFVNKYGNLVDAEGNLLVEDGWQDN
jgi:hypothetical protein